MMYILLTFIYPYMMLTLIEIAVKNRVKGIVILLLYHDIIFMFLHFVRLNSQCSPFLLPQCSWAMHASCLPSMLMTMHASPASLQCSWYMPPASLKCSWGCIASFLQISWCKPPASLPLWLWNSSDYLLQIPSSVNKKKPLGLTFSLKDPLPQKILNMTYHFLIDHTKILIDHTKKLIDWLIL